MEQQRMVVALGGNAILSKDASAQAQQAALHQTAQQLVKFIKQGHQLVIAHGNGPQVGNLLLQMEAGSTIKNPPMPLDTAVAMTQGSIGYWLQNELGEALQSNDLSQTTATIATQAVVDKNDNAFKHPSKPIGPFYSVDKINKLQKDHPDFTYVEDAGRGWRRVVPSPYPTNIVEIPALTALLNNNVIPIAGGGGGIPVIVDDDNKLHGVEAVIDKDFAAEKIAESVKADTLIILTAVDYVYVNFNKPDQKRLTQVSVEELRKYIDEDQFAPGSMLPKIQAAIKFIQSGSNKKAVITSLDNVSDFLKNKAGTIITA